ncbi:hypothetical protein AB0J90_11635 [Micromonospora sp. NPDC049523]|uniref:hypothetical protein n=1 Tax=Micromonospora sp. NPDC049523 TaxID=3155921 RepID=UPI003421D705
MSGVQGRHWQDESANASPTGRGETGLRAVDGPPPEEDADLAAAVRSTTRMRTAFYVVVLLIALGGQVSGAMEALAMPWYVALPAVGALELGGMVVLANADVRRRLGEHATLSRLLSAAIAGGAVAFNWLAHDNHLEGGFYGGMSLLGYLVWLMNTENKRRDRLRAKRQLPPTPPAYEVVGHWLRHPMLTRRARSLAKAAPGLGLYGSLDAARVQVRTERRQAALAKVLRRKIRRALDGTTADIAVAVYDLDEIARRLAERADYDGLTALIAADLAPARVLAGNLPANRRRWRRRRGTPVDAAALASAGQLLTDALAPPAPTRTAPDARSIPGTPQAEADTLSITGTPSGAADTRPMPVMPADGTDTPAITGTSPGDAASQSAPVASQGGTVYRPGDPESITVTGRTARPGEYARPVSAPSADVAPAVADVDPAAARVVRAAVPAQRSATHDDLADERPMPVADQPAPAAAARADDGVARSDPERNGAADQGDRAESGRPRWDALTAEVSAIFSTAQAQRRTARTANDRETVSGRTGSDRETVSGRTASDRETGSGRTGPDREASGSRTVADRESAPSRTVAAREASGRNGTERRSVSARIGADRETVSARIVDAGERVPEPARPVEPAPGPADGPPDVPLLERPLPDLVAAAKTRTLPPSQLGSLPAAGPVRPARGVAAVPSASEGSLRARVHALLDAEVTADDDRDNPALTDLVVSQLRLAPAERATVARYVSRWRSDIGAGRRTPTTERRLGAAPGQ